MYSMYQIVMSGNIQFLDANHQPHRDDGPAIICPNGSTYWYQHGKLHRIGGPAVNEPFGHIEFWINGVLQFHCNSVITAQPNTNYKDKYHNNYIKCQS